MASGQDGQFLKLDRDGKVLGAVGNGMGIGTGQFTEASYWVFDATDNLIAGDTSVGPCHGDEQVAPACAGLKKRRSFSGAVFI